MYQKEVRIVVTMFSTLLILGLYVLYVYNKYVAGNPEIINELQFWGESFLIMVPVMIVAQIILHIIFAIINKIVTNEDIPSITDEMDKLIELKSLRIYNWVNGIGFLLAMGALALDKQIWVFFVTMLSSCFVAAFFSGLAKIYYYRKGV